jgi:hypothetical protein
MSKSTLKKHKIYLGPPDIIYVELEHNSFCGRIINNQDILTSNDEEVTCLNCIANIFKYSSLVEQAKERRKNTLFPLEFAVARKNNDML